MGKTDRQRASQNKALKKAVAARPVDDFADEIRRLHRTARAVAGLTHLVHHLPAPCPDPDCDTLALVRADGASYVECRACGRVWSETEYRRLCLVLAAEAREGQTCGM